MKKSLILIGIIIITSFVLMFGLTMWNDEKIDVNDNLNHLSSQGNNELIESHAYSDEFKSKKIDLYGVYDSDKKSFNIELTVTFLKQPQYKQVDYIGISNKETITEHVLMGTVYKQRFIFTVNVTKQFYKNNKLVDEISKNLVYQPDEIEYGGSDGLYVKYDLGMVDHYMSDVSSDKEYTSSKVIVNTMILNAHFALKNYNTLTTSFGGWYAHMRYGSDDVIKYPIRNLTVGSKFVEYDERVNVGSFYYTEGIDINFEYLGK